MMTSTSAATARDPAGATLAGRGAPGAESRPVDLVHLARQTFGSRDLEREVLRLFVAQSAMLMDRVRHDAERSQAAHTLKGSARGIGAWRVARLADAMEKAATVPAETAPILAELADAVDEANLFIAGLLAD